jgi:UDP-glucose 4-epimerase
MVDVVTRFDPHLVLHLGVYEPNARANPAKARERSRDASLGVLGAAAECPSLEGIVVRSGIEVYGRHRNAPTRPDEEVAPHPTTTFGHLMLQAEELAHEAAATVGCPVTAVRLASVVGPHVPSPLGRYLRLPVVPMSVLADPAFSLVHVEDAARALVAACSTRWNGPVNVVAPGAVTTYQAVRLGGRVPLPLFGPEWMLARAITAAAGAPVPDHVLELVHRGRTADGSLAHHALGLSPVSTTPDVVKALYKWATVTHLTPVKAVA